MGADRLQEVVNNPNLAAIRADITRAEGRLQELMSRLGDNHPQVIEAKASIASLRTRLDTETRRVTGTFSSVNNINRQREVEIRAALEAQRARVIRMRTAREEGAVLVRDVEPGQIVQPGKALLSLALAGPTQLVAQVDERFLDQLEPGQKAAVVADAFAGQRFAARVLSIAPAVDAQRGAIEVKLALEQAPPDFLREDMTLSVEVETGRSERALALPLSVLRAPIEGDTAQLLVARDGRAELRRVRVGLRTLDAFAVQEGLSAEDWVLRAAAVQPGQRVRPRSVPWEPAAGMRTGGGAVGAALTQGMGR